MTRHGREVWITGIGIVSSLGEGNEATWQAFSAGPPNIDCTSFAPYVVHRLAAVDFAKLIPKSDLRMMDTWQRIGTYAAGLALENAGINGDSAILAHTDLMVVAGGGERDTVLDCRLLAQSRGAPNRARLFNETFMNELRPTLFLSQLSNMLAGNISVVHDVTGSSRTFMGEEAGIESLRVAHARVAAGQSDIVLLGGAHNGESKDVLLFCETGNLALKENFAPVFERQDRGGGIALGSFGAFLVIESKAHATARKARPMARLAAVVTDRVNRSRVGVDRSFERMWKTLAAPEQDRIAVLSGACGAEPVTSQEQAFLATLGGVPVRATGTYVGHGFESQFSMNVALAALASSRGKFFESDEGGSRREPDGPVARFLVTAAGHRRGEGLALVEPVHETS